MTQHITLWLLQINLEKKPRLTCRSQNNKRFNIRRINMSEKSTGIITGNKKTSMGLDENIAGALCYFLGFITGIVFLLTEKDNKFIKFHAIQSIACLLYTSPSPRD